MGNFIGQFFQSVSVTSTNSTVTIGFPARMVILINDGNNEVYFTLISDTATTSNGTILAGEMMTFSTSNPDSVTEELGAICTGAETSTLRVLAWK